ncbi:hypothetical protein [Rhodococcus koreensis]|uniref:hypothetical protein n=1 Tax=Rhodococcus koreensis TaxID=99653 RepID=UPI00366D36EA
MSVIRARAVNQARPETWASAKSTAAKMVRSARDFDGIGHYEMYVDETRLQLVNLAEYEDEAAWRRWIEANRPNGAELMRSVDVASMEVYGALSPELSRSISSYADSTIYQTLDLR